MYGHMDKQPFGEGHGLLILRTLLSKKASYGAEDLVMMGMHSLLQCLPSRLAKIMDRVILDVLLLLKAAKKEKCKIFLLN